MNYIVKGNLRGFYCGDCYDYLYNTTIKIYAVDSSTTATERASAREKDTFHQRSAEELNEISKRLIFETKTDERGNFVLELSEKQNYSGGAFDIDFECGTVPIRLKFPPKPKDPLQFHITTLQPQWREGDNILTASYEYGIAASYFCRIISLFDYYAICGIVKDCETKSPIRGVKVIAYDVDLLQDDELGDAITDSTGRFTIVYPADNFKKVLNSSWPKIEWPAGPDYYFKIIEPVTNIVLLQEDRSVGHRSDRENRGNCFCVSLCVDAKDVPPGNWFPALFERVGGYDILTDFTSTGFTNNAENNAFTGTIPLLGQLPSGTNSNSMEYRFRIINTDTSYELTPTQVKAAIPAFKIGELLRQVSVFPFLAHSDVIINPAVDADANGWIKVPRQNDFSVDGIGIFSPNGGVLANLNTAAVALDGTNTQFAQDDFDLTSPTVLTAGTSVPAPQRAAVHNFRIIFEAREVGTFVLTASNQLTAIVFCNVSYKQRRHPSWGYSGDTVLPAAIMLEIDETTAVNLGCGTIVDHVTADYTCCHPHMDTLNIYIEGNVPIPPPPTSFTQNVSGVNEAAGNQVFNSTAYPKCAYIVWLKLSLRLTSGYGRIVASNLEDHIAFCKS